MMKKNMGLNMAVAASTALLLAACGGGGEDSKGKSELITTTPTGNTGTTPTDSTGTTPTGNTGTTPTGNTGTTPTGNTGTKPTDSTGTTPTGNTGTTPTGNTGTTPTGFVSVINNKNLFPTCIQAGADGDPRYLACMSATYKGKSPFGEACQIEFNGVTKNLKFTINNDHYNLYGTNFESSLYNALKYDGELLWLTTSVYFKGKTVSHNHSVLFNFSANIDAASTYGRRITLNYDLDTVTDKKINCIISEYKLG